MSPEALLEGTKLVTQLGLTRVDVGVKRLAERRKPRKLLASGVLVAGLNEVFAGFDDVVRNLVLHRLGLEPRIYNRTLDTWWQGPNAIYQGVLALLDQTTQGVRESA
jgi:hypothetical protein